MKKLLVFANIAAALGGAQSVKYSARFAWITTARGAVVRVSRAKLPPVDQWTAFNLADAAS